MADTKPSAEDTTAKKAAGAAPKAAAKAKPASGDSSDAFAIVEASGTQMWLQPNRYYDLDRIHAEVDDTVTLDNVLLVKNSKGTTLGQPYVKDASVSLKVMAHRRGPKIIVYKMRPKKKTRRKNGHRQELTRVMVESISVGGKPIS
ncbi:MAG: 50S ribosomal protein L21 [Cyanobacteriota bacterium]|nr:50S ribosomal protein L21 [Cyanobacteriota bacterium]MED5384087.1 50S ribosomal protein L21 [Cyanobacteriota bacterium]